MTSAHLHLDDIGVTFGERDAVEGVSLLAQGGVTAVLGPNGSGKSTLLRCAATVLPPTTGSVRIDGLDPRRETERVEARRRLGYAPQSAGFDERSRVFDAIDYLAILKGFENTRRRRHAVVEALDLVGLTDRASSRVAELSGGMRRRLVIAQALLGTPQLLVLDEPTAGLDPDERLRLRQLLSDRRSSTTAVMATHLIDEAAVADTIVVLVDGRLQFIGSPTQLTQQAAGRVWTQTGFPPPGTRAQWELADGRTRCLGSPPPNADLAEPTIEDGYLLLTDTLLTSP